MESGKEGDRERKRGTGRGRGAGLARRARGVRGWRLSELHECSDGGGAAVISVALVLLLVYAALSY